MGLYATYDDGAFKINNAYIRLDRIWLSKSEGFNAWVHVYGTKDSSEKLAMFSVHCPYKDNVNPFTALYDTMSSLSFLTDQIPDTATAATPTAVVIDEVATPPAHGDVIATPEPEKVVVGVKIVKKKSKK